MSEIVRDDMKFERNKKDSLLIEKFDVLNGLIGIKRDNFLVLIGYMNIENNDNKTRNVRI
jgi:hypothetical protein